MRSVVAPTFSVIAILWSAASLSAQELFQQSVEGEIVPVPLAEARLNGGPVQVMVAPLAAGTDGSPTPILVPDAQLPAIFPSNLRVNLGFEYLRPEFPGRSVTLAIPAGSPSNFTILAGSGNVSNDFAFAPKIAVDYQFPDLGFGAGASGKLSSFSGHLNRSIDSGAGSATLIVNSTVSFVDANILEATKYVELDRFECFKCTCLQDTVFLFTIGVQYAHTLQDYTANLNSGSNRSALTAHEDFDGFGLTTSFSLLHPLRGDFFIYGVARGSFVVGTNNRNTNITVSISGNTATSPPALSENKTQFIPVGEFEVGLAWGKVLGTKRAQALAAAAAPKQAPLLWIKGGLIADIWGGLGLLSASDSTQSFTDDSMVLWGFSVLAGLDF
jgi:hypothetical protein